MHIHRYDMYDVATAEIDRIQIGFIRALAGQHRIRIVHLLGSSPMEVHDLAAELGLPQAAVSQNLAAMRAAGLVEATRDGRSVRYRLADPQILDACTLMRDVIVRRLSVLGSLAAAVGDSPLRQVPPAPPGAPLPTQVNPR
jgi:ArsR family transcriptional regulator, virulence genes transcriptional regulator